MLSLGGERNPEPPRAPRRVAVPNTLRNGKDPSNCTAFLLTLAWAAEPWREGDTATSLAMAAGYSCAVVGPTCRLACVVWPVSPLRDGRERHEGQGAGKAIQAADIKHHAVY